MNDKLAQALHYLIYLAKERNWPLGATRLAKSLVLSEVASMYYRHRPLTGTSIIKAPHGPIPSQFWERLDWLESEGRIKIKEGAQLLDSASYEPLSPPDLSGFEAQDLEILAEMGEICCKKYTTATLNELTHNYYWKIAKMGEEIPLAAYFWFEDSERGLLSAEETALIDQSLREEGLNV